MINVKRRQNSVYDSNAPLNRGGSIMANTTLKLSTKNKIELQPLADLDIYKPVGESFEGRMKAKGLATIRRSHLRSSFEESDSQGAPSQRGSEGIGIRVLLSKTEAKQREEILIEDKSPKKDNFIEFDISLPDEPRLHRHEAAILKAKRTLEMKKRRREGPRMQGINPQAGGMTDKLKELYIGGVATVYLTGPNRKQIGKALSFISR
jgi:hypothetical protein